MFPKATGVARAAAERWAAAHGRTKTFATYYIPSRANSMVAVWREGTRLTEPCLLVWVTDEAVHTQEIALGFPGVDNVAIDDVREENGRIVFIGSFSHSTPSPFAITPAS